MYGKIFAQIFSSTVIELPLFVRYVWMSLLTICEKDGIINATPASIARQINLPVDQVQQAIDELCKPDPLSRSPEEEGRRLVPTRSTYGWRVVNYAAYRAMYRQEDRREYLRTYQREYMRKRRGASHRSVRPVLGVAKQKSTCETNSNAFVSSFDVDSFFEAEWKTYPAKFGKQDALAAFRKSVTTRAILEEFRNARAGYQRCLAAETWRNPMHGSRFFNAKNWREYVDWQPAARPESRPAFTPVPLGGQR